MAILVVASDDGVMPQTREHLEILALFGAKTGFVVLSKADMVDKETMELAELEIREVVGGTVFQGKPVIPFSALDRQGLWLRSDLPSRRKQHSWKPNPLAIPSDCGSIKWRGAAGFGSRARDHPVRHVKSG